MPVVVVLVILGLIFGGIGLLVEAFAWALVIGLVLLVAGAVAGFTGRGRASV